MTLDEAIAILEHYNNWRRDDSIQNKYDLPDPKKIGLAIDYAINALKKGD